jgi:hypothetical protein
MRFDYPADPVNKNGSVCKKWWIKDFGFVETLDDSVG